MNDVAPAGPVPNSSESPALTPLTGLLLASASLVLFWISRRYHALQWTEAVGFVTGGWCVWLTVRQHIANWPIGIASNVFYIVVLRQAHLYADMTLQVVYVVLGVLGWYWWLHGGRDSGRLDVSRTPPAVWGALCLLATVATAGMTLFLRHIHDSAPFWDALTTVLSLVAQYMLTKKLLENWLVWMTADVIYVGLYVYKHLYLTAGLYVLFFGLCVLGLSQWRRTVRA